MIENAEATFHPKISENSKGICLNKMKMGVN